MTGSVTGVVPERHGRRRPPAVPGDGSASSSASRRAASSVQKRWCSSRERRSRLASSLSARFARSATGSFSASASRSGRVTLSSLPRGSAPALDLQRARGGLLACAGPPARRAAGIATHGAASGRGVVPAILREPGSGSVIDDVRSVDAVGLQPFVGQPLDFVSSSPQTTMRLHE